MYYFAFWLLLLNILFFSYIYIFKLLQNIPVKLTTGKLLFINSFLEQ